MKFDVLNRFTGEVNFTADIDCDKGDSRSIKLGLAVKWGIKNNANLSSADLNYADLNYADLSYADLNYADLSYADLSYADLSYADLGYANLSYASLNSANLIYANLNSANLSYASLQFSLGTVHDNIKFIQIDTYHIVYTSDVLCIGCEKHPINEWREFDDERIIQMDGKAALKFWRKYQDFIFMAIELAPAKPTGFIEKEVKQ